MFGHPSRNNRQGKVSLRPQQEIEDLSEEAQPVGSARTRSLLLSGPTFILTLLEEIEFRTTEEVRWDMWRGPANEQTKNKEAATRCDMDLLIIEEIQVNSYPNRSQNMQMQYFWYTHYELFASKCIDALYFYLAWW